MRLVGTARERPMPHDVTCPHDCHVERSETSLIVFWGSAFREQSAILHYSQHEKMRVGANTTSPLPLRSVSLPERE